MTLCLTPRITAIAQVAMRRSVSFFADDMAAQAGRLRAMIAGARVLVVGGAGSIGAATIEALLPFAPVSLTVIDPQENNLAELIRSLRGRPGGCPAELNVAPLDYGSALCARYLAGLPACDLVLSFAALKHVRSERDPFSVLRLLEVNLAAADRFLSACAGHGHGRRGVFFVSTDKAADPVSLMGASKRAMELLLWQHAASGAFPRVTTTRFANVAFSDGSLPWGFLQRLEKRQPLAAPSDVRRYLVSAPEAGQLCLLAALCAPAQHVLIPLLDATRDAVTFTAIAEATLAERGLAAEWHDDETTALAGVEAALAARRWPVLRTRTDTSGEKEMEIFTASGEVAEPCGLSSCRAIKAPTLTAAQRTELRGLIAWIETVCAGNADVPEKAAIVARLNAVLPGLRHAEAGKSLDARL